MQPLGLCEQYFNHDINPPSQWSSTEALYVHFLYIYVRYLADNLASVCGDMIRVKMKKEDSIEASRPPSAMELLRIERSLCRYEMWINLFTHVQPRNPNPHIISKEEEAHAFFKRFAPWESEQLFCIHHHLFSQMSIRKFKL